MPLKVQGFQWTHCAILGLYMTKTLNYRDPESLISDLRHGQLVLLLLDDSGGGVTGIVTIAAELCEARHITFMARQARGLICLGLTRERCDYLHLPLMVEGQGDTAPLPPTLGAGGGSGPPKFKIPRRDQNTQSCSYL